MSFWSIIQPQETTNLVTNPSFETNTTNWSVSGSNTIAQSSSQQYSGSYSLLCTYQSSTTVASYTFIPDASTTYVASVWIYVPTNWDGDDIRINPNLFSGASTSNEVIWNASTSPNNTWVRISAQIDISVDITGTISVVADATPTAGRFIYVDAMQIELGTELTSFCDGSIQGCQWNGVEHASTSTRNAREATGGKVLNFEDDLALYIADEAGTGMLPVKNHSSPLPLAPGSLFDGFNYDARGIVFDAHLSGSSVSDFHSKKQALINALSLDNHRIYEKPQPRVLEYTGAGDTKRINVVYDGGLERGLPSQVTDDPDIKLRFRADDPLFYSGDGGGSLTTQDSTSVGVFVGKVDGEWSNLSAVTTGIVNAIAIWNGDLYIGGNFLNWDGIGAADYIAKWNGSNWAAVGTFTGSIIYKIKAGTDGIYVGSDNGFYKWDGSSWTTPGSPSFAGRVYDFDWGNDGKVYLVGTFINWDGDAASDYITVYDIAADTFSPMGTGANALLRAVIGLSNGTVYFGGDATSCDSVSSNRIFKYDIATDTVIAISDGYNGAPYSLVADASGRIYCGGSYTSTDYDYISYIENDVIFGMGDADNIILSVSLDVRGRLFAAGGYSTIGDLTTLDRIAVWNGSVWNRLDANLPGASSVTAVFADGEDFYIGYTNSGTMTHAYSNTLTNNGSAIVYPILTIRNNGSGSMDLVQVKNETTGATLYFDYSLLEGEIVTLDTRPGKQTMTSNLRGNVWNELKENSDFGSFYLIQGDNSISAYQSNSSASDKIIDVHWPNAFLSQD